MDYLDYTDWKESYDNMMKSYEDLVAEAEFRAEYKKETEQLKRLEENKNGLS